MPIKNGSLTIRRLHADAAEEVAEFIAQEFDDTDIEFAGMKNKTFNFDHSCFIYFGMFESGKLVALHWFDLAKRGVIEQSIMVGKSARQRGVLAASHQRDVEVADRLRLRHVHKINNKNEVVLNMLRKKPYLESHEEGHLVIFESKARTN